VRTIFFDIDTQLDFLYPAGALYVPGAELIEPTLVRLNHHAAANGILVISTMDAHTENDPEFKAWPAHCVAGTLGQRKPAGTLLPNAIVISNNPGKQDLQGAPQILLEKQTFSCFSNCRLQPILDNLKADRYVVYGVVTEICVRLAALGLLETGAKVELVTDAVKHLDQAKQQDFLKEFGPRGGQLTTIASIVGHT